MNKQDSKNLLSQKRRTNRKRISKEPMFNFEGQNYEVDVRGSGIYHEIMQRILEQLHIGLEIHKRLLLVRFDLHSKTFKDDNKEIRAFRKRVVTWVERNYKTHSVGSVWARERETTKHQHYHFALWIDGDKIQHSKKIIAYIRDKWDAIDPSNHHTPDIKNPFYFIDSEGVLHDAVYRLSYLAKVRGKGYRPEQAKDYSTSRLKIRA